jgi:hypothetical protein
MTAGRPTAYDPDFAEQARIACARGATNDDLAVQFAVSPRTVDRWIAAIPDFADAVREGRAAADDAVVSALFARATGARQTLTRVFCHEGQPLTVNYTVTLAPDVRACIFWLRNRRPEAWREKPPAAAIDTGITFAELEEAGRRVVADS